MLVAAVATTGGLLIAGPAASRESDGADRVTPTPILIRPRYLDDSTYVEVDVDLARSRVTSEWIIERVGWLIVGSRTGN